MEQSFPRFVIPILYNVHARAEYRRDVPLARLPFTNLGIFETPQCDVSTIREYKDGLKAQQDRSPGQGEADTLGHFCPVRAH